MGLFDKFKKIVSKTTEEKDKVVVESYDKGLKKTRDEFVSKLSLLGIKYTRVSDAYFEELDKEMAACNGNIVTFWEKDSLQCLGYIVYMCEYFPEIAESVFE